MPALFAFDNGRVLLSFTLPPPGIMAILLVLVAGAAAYEIPYRRIPNWLTATRAPSGLGMNMFLCHGWSGLRTSLGGLALGFGAYFAPYMLRAMGADDVKLMAAIGVMVGWRNWGDLQF